MFGFFKKKPAFDLDSAIDSALTRAHNTMMSQLNHAKRGFDSAEQKPYTDSWESMSNEINIDLMRQLPIIRSRSRNLARNNEWAERYLIQLKDNVIGQQGIRLQMRLPNKQGKPDKHNDYVEMAWDNWGLRGNCEVSGKLTWHQIETLVIETLARDGEFFIRLRPGIGPMGFMIQVINPALIDVMHNGSNGKNRIRMGIEINDDGKVIAYWVRAGKSGEAAPSPYSISGQHIRIPAEEMIHGFDMREVDQLRGVPWLNVGARRLWLLQDFEESAAVASNNAAKRQGFFISPNGDTPSGFADTIVSSVMDTARAQGKVLTPEEIERIVAAAEKYSTTMPGQFDTLPQGYDFKAYESAWPNIDASSYIKQQVRGFSAARGMSYATLGNDLEAVNYSSARVGIIDERERYKMIQELVKSSLHIEVFKHFLPFSVLTSSKLSPQRIEDYLSNSSWQPRRWVGIDPLKEAKANETNLMNGLTSRRRIQMERGDDPDEIMTEIAEDEAFYMQYLACNKPVENSTNQDMQDIGEN